MRSGVAERRTFECPEGEIEYRVLRTLRQRTVAITVEPNRLVTVLAPKAAAPQRIEGIVRRRAKWIRRQWRTLDGLPARESPRQWVAGETHRYLGRQYRLKPVVGDSRGVRLSGGYFIVTVPQGSDRAGIARLMQAWYREHAQRLLVARVERALAATTWLDVPMPVVNVRRLAQRWGSALPGGRVSFNLDLVKLPLGCIDYVVAHELVHLKIPNHGPAFWRMLSRVMPDWKGWRERLGSCEL